MNKEDVLFEVEEDFFNTQHFNLKMGNIKIKTDFLEERNKNLCKRFEDAISKAKEEGYKHLTFKIATNQKEIIKSITSQQMEIADTLVRYMFDFSKSILPEIQYKCTLNDCKIENLQYLKDIARNSFKIDRFHSDKNLPDNLCDLYYDKWIENSYNGYADKVIVAHYNNDVVGFTTGNLKPDEEFSQLVLSAVSDKYRGIGVYTSMIHHGTKWLFNNKSYKTKGIIVGTQIDNIAVQKAWIRLGYTIYDSQYVFQKYIG